MLFQCTISVYLKQIEFCICLAEKLGNSDKQQGKNKILSNPILGTAQVAAVDVLEHVLPDFSLHGCIGKRWSETLDLCCLSLNSGFRTSWLGGLGHGAFPLCASSQLRSVRSQRAQCCPVLTHVGAWCVGSTSSFVS